MATFIEKYANESYTLKLQSGITDGKPTYTSYTVKGLSITSERTAFESSGNVSKAKQFLVAPLSDNVTPVLPAKIICNSVEYDIANIDCYKNLQGVLQGWKLTTVQ